MTGHARAVDHGQCGHRARVSDKGGGSGSNPVGARDGVGSIRWDGAGRPSAVSVRADAELCCRSDVAEVVAVNVEALGDVGLAASRSDCGRGRPYA